MRSEARIRQIIADKLGTTPNKVTPEIKVGGELQDDSLDHIGIVIDLEDEFNLEIPDEDAEAWKTVADVIAYVDGKVVAESPTAAQGELLATEGGEG